MKKIFINPTNESLRAHFHFYITNKTRNEIAHYIDSLDSSDGRAIGYDPQGEGSIPLWDRILFLIIESSQLLEKEFCLRGGSNP